MFLTAISKFCSPCFNLAIFHKEDQWLSNFKWLGKKAVFQNILNVLIIYKYFRTFNATTIAPPRDDCWVVKLLYI